MGMPHVKVPFMKLQMVKNVNISHQRPGEALGSSDGGNSQNV